MAINCAEKQIPLSGTFTTLPVVDGSNPVYQAKLTGQDPEFEDEQLCYYRFLYSKTLDECVEIEGYKDGVFYLCKEFSAALTDEPVCICPKEDYEAALVEVCGDISSTTPPVAPEFSLGEYTLMCSSTDPDTYYLLFQKIDELTSATTQHYITLPGGLETTGFPADAKPCTTPKYIEGCFKVPGATADLDKFFTRVVCIEGTDVVGTIWLDDELGTVSGTAPAGAIPCSKEELPRTVCGCEVIPFDDTAAVGFTIPDPLVDLAEVQVQGGCMIYLVDGSDPLTKGGYKVNDLGYFEIEGSDSVTNFLTAGEPGQTGQIVVTYYKNALNQNS